MKTKLLGWTLLFLVIGTAFPLSAQQSEADQVNAIKAKAEKGDAEAQYNLGVYYDNGQGVAKDEIEAVNWYRKAAEQNNVSAQYNLGVSYAFGQGVAKNELEAVKWFRKAADQNHAAAQYNLGFCYLNGRGLAKDGVEAVKWYRRAAEQNYATAQNAVGDCYANGEGVVKDEVMAVGWYRKAAEQSYSEAEFNLGVCYRNGQGVAKDETQAVEWFRKAAEQNFVQAQSNLGICYYSGQGVAKDQIEAVKWYRKAALQNYATAQYNLGICYASGQGVAKDEVEAYKWFLLAAGQGNESAKKNVAVAESRLTRKQIAEGRKLARDFKPLKLPSVLPNSPGIQTSAQQSEIERKQLASIRAKAEKGDAESQLELASVFYLGKFGVSEDNVEAVKWCRKAADQGFADAQYRLGNFYFKGEGVAKDGVVANEWFRKSAEQNYAAGQYMLGLAFAQGDDARKDYVEAYKWVLLAAANGDDSAKQYMKHGILEAEMSPEQITEGQKLAREFKPRKAPRPGTAVSDSDLFDSRPLATGTGFFISEDGFLISNAHVIEGATQIRLLTSAGLIDAKVVQVDAANDLALLKAVGRFAPLPIIASRTVNLGGTVAAVGFPNIGLQGFSPKLPKEKSRRCPARRMTRAIFK
jgi:TPR repeat protein